MPFASPEAKRAYQREWVAERRWLFFSDKSCEWCGSFAHLQLHHRDVTKKKEHKVWSWSAERRSAEIAKCIVLCASCHRRAHSQARRLEAELRHAHGSIERYWLGCKCEPCLGARRTHERSKAA